MMRRALASVFVLWLAAAAAAVAAKKLKRGVPPELPETYAIWLTEVDVLISDEEWRTFVELTKDYQRDLFIRRFWELRDPDPKTRRNELRERFELRLAVAREITGGDVKDARARLVILNGSPSERVEFDCDGYWPLEIWKYLNGTERRRQAFVLIFFRPYGVGAWRLWDPRHDGLGAFYDRTDVTAAGPPADGEIDFANPPPGCGDEMRELLEATRWTAAELRADPFSLDKLTATLTEPEPAPSDEWVLTLAAYSTDVPANVTPFASDLTFAFPGWHDQRTVVQGLLKVQLIELKAAPLGGFPTYSLTLNGELLREGTPEKDDEAVLHEAFRMRFDLPAEDYPLGGIKGGKLWPVVFERYLRPGPYRVVLRLEDVHGRRMSRHEVALDVPRPEERAAPPQTDPEIERVLDEAYRLTARGEAAIEILRPRDDVLLGLQRFDTLTVGERVEAVVFRLDGEEKLKKTRPPYSVELDLGPLPAAHLLEAVALDTAGEELASDELMLNASPHRFAVRLVEPVAERRYQHGLRVRAEVEVPQGGAVERIELFRGDQRMATLYQPPYTHPMALADDGLVLVRAVAYLADGTAAEDVVLVNSPAPIDEVAVDLVELYTSVADSRERPVLDLGSDDFRIFEDGVEQRLVRFEKMDDLPIHAVVLLDTSASMVERLEASREAALTFFGKTVGERDRMAAITFNEEPRVASPFTGELERFARGLAGVRAERGTALYDSLIYALYYSNGLPGQRAVLLLSDGLDESSRFELEQALDYVRRAGVAIYPIGLGLGSGGRRSLKRFAEETGGRAFFLDDISELAGAYRTIREELRTKYLIAYQSSASGEGFRRVEVILGRGGLKARTIRGYYP